MSAAELPPIVQKQPKTINGTALSFWKAGMGAVVENYVHGMNAVKNNKLPSTPNASNVPEATEDDGMRIDSDDIQYHFHTQNPWVPDPNKAKPSSLLPSLAKIGVGAALAGTGIGLPFALPSILSGIGDVMKSAAVAPANPGTPDAPTINIGGTEYQLNLGKEDQ